MRCLLIFICLFRFVSGNGFEDKSVLQGKLENGLTYYVKQNGYLEEQAYVELIVKVGSIYERDDELGYAHLVEHLVFRGSEHFKDGEAIQYMESMGAWDGEDSNAETGFDYTKYHFMIPLNDREALRKTLLILSDFAAKATFSEGVVQKEKGVVLDEFHEVNSDAEIQSGDRMLKEFLPLTPFANRLPIGTEESIRNVTSERLKAFYRRWYTPDRMAVIAIGDVEPDVVYGIIKEIFESISAPKEKTPEPIFEVKLPKKSKAVIHVDPELTKTMLSVVGYEFAPKEWTVRNDCLEYVLFALFTNRLKEFASLNQGYFYSVDVKGNILGLDALEVGIIAYLRDNYREAAHALFGEIHKINNKGFTKSDLEKVRILLRKQWSKELDDDDRIAHDKLSNDLENHFLLRWPIISNQLLLKHHLSAIEDITVEEVNTFLIAKFYEADMIFLSTPEDVQDLDEGALLRIFEEDGSTSGKITSTELEKQYGITTWTLNNGISVSLKSTRHEKQHVMIQAQALGGLSSTESPEEYMSAQLLFPYVYISGIGPFSHQDLNNLGKNEKLHFNVSLDHDSRSINAEGHEQDIETMFEILHAFFAAPPAFSSTIWSGLNETMSTLIEQYYNAPGARFNNFIDKVYSHDNFRMSLFDTKLTDESLTRKLYDRFFGAPQAFHFSIVGDFTIEEVKPLVKKYLGSIPNRAPEVLASAMIIETPKESLQYEFKFGKISNTKTVIGFTYNTQETTPDVKSSFAFNVMSNVLQRRLHNLLREDLGQTYNVSVQRYGIKDTNVCNDVLQISFSSQEDHREAMIQHTLRAIEEMKTGVISQEELLMAQQTCIQAYKKMERSNSYWSDSINYSKNNSIPLKALLDYESNITLVTTEDVKEMVHRVFDGAHPSVISHLPAVKKS